jgi:excisionase family DNA binding protein
VSEKPTRLALTRAEAAAAIGVSVDSFERFVQPEIRVVRRGRLRLVPVSELERWLERNAARTLE